MIVMHEGKPALLTFGESTPKAIPGVSADDYLMALEHGSQVCIHADSEFDGTAD